MKNLIKKVIGGIRSLGKRLLTILDPYADDQISQTDVFDNGGAMSGTKNKNFKGSLRTLNTRTSTTVSGARLSQQELQGSLSPEYRELHQRLDHWLRTTGDGHYDHKIPQDIEAYKKQLDSMRPILDSTDKKRALEQERYMQSYRASSEAVARQRATGSASTIAKVQSGVLTKSFANATSPSTSRTLAAAAPVAARTGTTMGTRAPKAATRSPS